eukprot:2519698-Rhodomonas_salina.1
MFADRAECRRAAVPLAVMPDSYGRVAVEVGEVRGVDLLLLLRSACRHPLVLLVVHLQPPLSARVRARLRSVCVRENGRKAGRGEVG